MRCGRDAIQRETRGGQGKFPSVATPLTGQSAARLWGGGGAGSGDHSPGDDGSKGAMVRRGMGGGGSATAAPSHTSGWHGVAVIVMVRDGR